MAQDTEEASRGIDHPPRWECARERRFYGASADKEIVKEPVYDVKALDKSVTRVAREIRLLEQALKATNAKTVVEAYDQDDAALGELT